MKIEVNDISLLSRARRNCALALQLLRISYVIGYIGYLILVVGLVVVLVLQAKY